MAMTAFIAMNPGFSAACPAPGALPGWNATIGSCRPRTPGSIRWSSAAPRGDGRGHGRQSVPRLHGGHRRDQRGHSHPKVVAAIRRQAGRLIHMSGTDFYYAPQVRLAERLARPPPAPIPKRVFFTNSGAEVDRGGPEARAAAIRVGPAPWRS